MNSKQLIKIWARVLAGACDGKTAAAQTKIVGRLKEILKGKKKEYLLPKIVENALALMAKENRFEIVLAHEQSGDTFNKLKERLARVLGASDAKVKIDAALIGGFIAKTDRCLIDASVKGLLEQLRKMYQD
ncbi:MAG: F0F1 ATP synthase subunit delta [Candidatus Paceibacterota bacterium]